MTNWKNLAGPIAVAAMFAVTAGCATKRYVRNTVEPIDKHVNAVEQATNQNKDAIGKLGEKEETDVSRVGERAMSAESAARDAGNAAKQADQKASDAQSMAKNASDNVTQLNQTFNQTVQKIDSYQLLSTEKVLFHFNSASLTKEAREKLDSTVQNMANTQHYVIEVQGFTDTSGSKSYNLALSQRRADAVVRYLMVQHHIPLYRIHLVGLGVDEPAADNHTRAGRKENRRVEVRLFAGNWTGGAAEMGQQQGRATSQEQTPKPVE